VTRIPRAATCLAWSALLLTAFAACEDYNYSPGAGRQDVTYYLIVSEPTGDIRQPRLGVVWDISRPERCELRPLLQLRSMGVEAILPAGSALDMPVLFPDPAADPANPSSYSFTGADSTMQLIREAGLDPMLSISIDECLMEFRDSTAQRGSDCADALTAVTSGLVGHFADAGVRDEAVIARVELTGGLSGSCSLEEMPAAGSNLLNAMSALMREFPSMPVGGGGFGEDVADSLLTDAKRFIRECAETDTRPAFISCRLETDDPLRYAGLGRELRSTLDEQGIAGMELLLSGWGPPARALNGQTPSMALLTASWMQIQDAGFTEIYLTATADWACSNDGTPSSVLGLFALWQECAKHPVRLGTGITMDGDQWSAPVGAETLWALAGEDSRGELAILLANLTADTVRVDLSLLTPGLLAGFSDSVIRIDPLNGGLMRRPLDDGPLEIMPDEALLVIAAPELPGADTPGRRL